MNKTAKTIAISLVSVGVAIGGFIKGIDYLCYSTKTVSGVVTDIQITKPAIAKQIDPDWIPLPGLDGRNYWDMPAYAIITISLDPCRTQGQSKTYAAALCLNEDKPLPDIGTLVSLKVDKFGVYKPITGDEPRFKDGTPNLNYAKAYPSIEDITF